MIVLAAIKHKGRVMVGARHGTIGSSLHIMYGESTSIYQQGFVDDKGVFMDRQESLIHARACGQINGPLYGSVLTSEDLW